MRRCTRCLLLSLSLFVAIHSTASAQTAVEDQVVTLVNAERIARGLGPLVPDSRLAAAASDYAVGMASGDFFSHTGLSGSTVEARSGAHGYVDWHFLGENLARGQATPERVVAQWLTSPAHRANVLSSEACDIGVGYAYAPASRFKRYWAMEIGC